jgi:hypothetical protein
MTLFVRMRGRQVAELLSVLLFVFQTGSVYSQAGRIEMIKAQISLDQVLLRSTPPPQSAKPQETWLEQASLSDICRQFVVPHRHQTVAEFEAYHQDCVAKAASIFHKRRALIHASSVSSADAYCEQAPFKKEKLNQIDCRKDFVSIKAMQRGAKTGAAGYNHPDLKHDSNEKSTTVCERFTKGGLLTPSNFSLDSCVQFVSKARDISRQPASELHPQEGPTPIFTGGR